MTRRNARSAEAQSWRHLYRTAAWKRLRQQALIRDGYQCRMCGALLSGRKGDNNAPEVDHVREHKGDRALFLDLDNLQSLCAWPCHASHKQAAERRGYSDAIGIDGWPIDPKHPSNRPR